mgnify:CR=1 FL=1
MTESQNMKATPTLLFLFLSITLFAQTISVSENLLLNKVTPYVYIHTQGNNNGMVFCKAGEALIVSTPASDEETGNLINYVRDSLKADIVGYIIDRWHTDAMEGLDVVMQHGIPTYSYAGTKDIARKKGLPQPEMVFDSVMELEVGGSKVIAHYPGEAHTKDGIVVWIPDEKVLFGGNGIRNNNGWVGNIGDANLAAWSETVRKVKVLCGTAMIVIPGHGRYGGSELLDYTIALYDTTGRGWELNSPVLHQRPDFNGNEFLAIAKEETHHNGITTYNDAVVYYQDATKYIRIESACINYIPGEQRLDSDNGIVSIYDKNPDGDTLRLRVPYERLIVFNVEDSIGLRVVLQRFGSLQ